MTSDPTGELPETVPARMLNEYLYCPRLFYMEWAQQRFETSDDVEEGRWRHRRTDEPRGSLPEPGTIWSGEATSVDLTSESLGITARLDLVRGTGRGVVPVDTKKGRSPKRGREPWPSDRIQIACHMALLRAAGYQCDQGELFFTEDRRKVVIPWSDSLETELMEAVRSARSTALAATPPEPLIDSPKCPRCSLVTLCLPDEVNHEQHRSEDPPRRLVARDIDARPLYVTDAGSWVGVSRGRVQVHREGDRTADVRLIDVTHICLYGNVQISSQAVSRLLGEGKPIVWFSHGGWFRGLAHGLPGKNVDLRLRQTQVATGDTSKLASHFVEGKIRNCRTLLMRNAKPRPQEAIDRLLDAAESARSCSSIPSLLGVEGAAARTYWHAFPQMLSKSSLPGNEFSFEGRNRRPPRDAVNCLLSYVYGLLAKDLTVSAFTVGFDPYLGFYHRPRFGRPALALDLAEEFRPLIGDSVVIGLINNDEIRPQHFIVRGSAVGLTKDGRRTVLGAYERRLDTKIRHPVFGYRVSYRRVLDLQVRMLAALLLGDIDEYTPMVTR